MVQNDPFYDGSRIISSHVSVPSNSKRVNSTPLVALPVLVSTPCLKHNLRDVHQRLT